MAEDNEEMQAAIGQVADEIDRMLWVSKQPDPNPPLKDDDVLEDESSLLEKADYYTWTSENKITLAIRYDGQNLKDIYRSFGTEGIAPDPVPDTLKVRMRPGTWINCHAGDWIVCKDFSQNFFVCDDTDFRDGFVRCSDDTAARNSFGTQSVLTWHDTEVFQNLLEESRELPDFKAIGQRAFEEARKREDWIPNTDALREAIKQIKPERTPTHAISMTIMVGHPDEFTAVMGLFHSLQEEFGHDHPGVIVSSSLVEEEDAESQEVHGDDQIMRQYWSTLESVSPEFVLTDDTQDKVLEAIKSSGPQGDYAFKIFKAIRTAGIVFRERVDPNAEISERDQGVVTHNDQTLVKVYAGLRAAGVPENLLMHSVNAIRTAGIVFREPSSE